jgi:hypothetical protein
VSKNKNFLCIILNDKSGYYAIFILRSTVSQLDLTHVTTWHLQLAGAFDTKRFLALGMFMTVIKKAKDFFDNIKKAKESYAVFTILEQDWKGMQ